MVFSSKQVVFSFINSPQIRGMGKLHFMLKLDSVSGKSVESKCADLA